MKIKKHGSQICLQKLGKFLNQILKYEGKLFVLSNLEWSSYKNFVTLGSPCIYLNVNFDIKINFYHSQKKQINAML